MADPKDINPFAKYVETPTPPAAPSAPAPQAAAPQAANPFAKYAEWSTSDKILDVAKGPLAGMVSGLGGVPAGIVDTAKGYLRTATEPNKVPLTDLTKNDTEIMGFKKPDALIFAEQFMKKGPAAWLSSAGQSAIKEMTGTPLAEQIDKQNKQQQQVDQAISAIPDFGTRNILKKTNDWSDSIRDSRSEAGKLRIENSQITGNLVKSLREGTLQDISFGKDPSFAGYAMQGTEVLGSLLPIIGTALITKNPTIVTGVGYGMGAGEGVQTAIDHVGKMSDADLMKASPYFAKMIQDGVDPAKARKVVTDKAAEQAAMLQGSVSAFGSNVTGKIFTGAYDKVLTGAVKNRIARIALGGSVTGAEEGTQEFLEGIAADLGINKSVVREIGTDSFANFLMGAMGGGPGGALKGATVKGAGEEKKEPKVDKYAMNEGPTGEPPVPPAGAVPPTGPVPPTPPAPVKTKISEEEVDFEEPKVEPKVKAEPLAETPKAEEAPTFKPSTLEKEDKQEWNKLVLESKVVGQELHMFPEALTPERKQELVMREAQIDAKINELENQQLANQKETKQPTFDEWRTEKGIIFGSKEEYETKLPALQQQYEQEVLGVKAEEPKAEEVKPEVTPPKPIDQIQQKIGDEQLNVDYHLNDDGIFTRVDEINGEKQELTFVTKDGDREWVSNEVVAKEGLQPIKVTEEEAKGFINKEKEFVKSEAEKYEASKAEEVAPEPKKTKAEINRERQAEKKVKTTEAKKKPVKKLEPQTFNQDEIQAAGQLANKGTGIEYGDQAKPFLNKLEKAGLITQKNGKVFFTKEAKAAGIKEGSSFSQFANSSDMKALEAFLKQEKAAKVEAKEAHIEGNKSEPVTSKTIEESIDKAETKVDYKKIKQSVKNQFDQAIKRATLQTEEAWKKSKDKENMYVNIDIPGDGKFKVKNNVERLKALQSRLMNAAAPKEGKAKRETSAASVSAADVAFKNLVDGNDIEAAIEYAKLKKLNLDPNAGQVKLDAEQRKKVEEFFGTKEKYLEFKKEIGAEVTTPKKAATTEKLAGKDNVIEGEFIDVTNRKLLTDQTKKLSKEESNTLAEHYGETVDTDAYYAKIRDDVVAFVNKGADAVNKAIRDIIKKIATGVMAFAVVMNPAYMNKPSIVMVPTFKTEARVVQAKVPEQAKAMSDGAQKVYQTIMPALKDQGYAGKNFTIVDKPNARIYVFNPDGSYLTDSKVILGKAQGDFYVGKTDYVQNRNTPAGPIEISAEKGGATYDGKTIYTFRFGTAAESYSAAIMHEVYLKESDAPLRKAALAKEEAEGARLSHGCVNGKPEFMAKIGEDTSRMDKSVMFVVPDNAALLDSFINNTVSGDDVQRVTIQPKVEVVKTKEETPKQKPSEKAAIREEEMALPPSKTQAEINQERQKAKLSAARTADRGTFFNDFGSLTKAEIDQRRQEIRDEKIKQLGVISRALRSVTKKVAGIGSTLNTQQKLNYLLEKQEQLRSEISATKKARRGADWFRARAMEGLAKDEILPETMAVIDAVYAKNPAILDGLKLSIKEQKQAGVNGNFEPFGRIVTLFKNPFNINEDRTMRHEITHSLEQMMTPEAQMAVIDKWSEDLAKAIKNNPGKAEQDYFQAVLKFVENPTKDSYKKATKLLPSYDFYQYINPSEYWAVNAEKLLNAYLGTPWARFVKAVKGLFEGLKNVFGFDNKYVLHREFNRIMNGDQKRITTTMLAEYLIQNDVEIDFLNDFNEYDQRREEDGRNPAPIHGSPSVKDKLLGSFRETRRVWKQVIANPMLPKDNLGGKLARAITYARVKNVWYGKGLEIADARKYSRELRDSEGKAIASIAVTNALHAGNIVSQAIVLGKVVYNQATQMFQAVEDKFSMANVMMAKHELMDRVGVQRANNIIQDFFEAKRSRSIVEEFLARETEIPKLEEKLEKIDSDIQSEFDDAKREKLDQERAKVARALREAQDDLDAIKVPLSKVNMTDEQIDYYSALENEHPELRTMMDNWTAVNRNTIDNMEFSNLISAKKAETLRNIKDYVPWQRVMDDTTDVHVPTGPVRSLTNVPQPKKFSEGEVDRDIDDVVDNMLNNTMKLNRAAMRNHAANQVAMAYATRKPNGKIQTFSQEGIGPNGEVRTNVVINGKRVIIEIADPLIAESVMGMEAVAIPGMEIFGFLANNLRRGVTLWPQFQLKQLFMDAPTAAWVSGVKNPTALYAGTMVGFFKALRESDPIVQTLKSYGIGGYQSVHRRPEEQYKKQIGLLEGSKVEWVTEKLDRIGDASDYAQRIAIYNRVLKETGDEMQAIIQANNVIDFMKHGSGKLAQFLTRTVSFMNAYAQQIDVLAEALAGSGMKGMSRKQAMARLAMTGAQLAFWSTMYTMAVGGDDDYEELDDQTKLRNFVIPRRLAKQIGIDETILLPMHTSASFFFKSIPEMIYNKVTKEGTKNEIDNSRLRKALSQAALDSLLGPDPVPTGVKPVVEIAFNHSFFTGKDLVPSSLKGLKAAEQYNGSTSELGKWFSSATFGALNPIQADHLVRGIFGTTGSMAQWGSNFFSGDERIAADVSRNPLFAGMVAPEVGRGNEDLFYKLKEEVEPIKETFETMHQRGKHDEADKYYDKHEKEIMAAGYTQQMSQSLKEINKYIRWLEESKDTGMSAQERRDTVNEMKRQKQDMLDDVIGFRKEAGL